MKLFLDTNIIIDLIANRLPFSKWAYQIFKDSKEGKWELFTSSNAILTSYYIIEKQIGKKRTKRVINILLERLDLCTIDKSHLESAITADFSDYEDAVQHECAKLHGNIDYIITRNKKDFKNSKIDVLSSEELYSIIQ
jgi:predicted nucleic acid-binding protein